MSDGKLVIIGTSGSTDYLRDATGDQRSWPVQMGAPRSDTEESCDGIHDEGAPLHHLCTRCFPDLTDRVLKGDLFGPGDDECDEVRQDEDQEIE
jgi:hypothetical protein